MVKGVPNDHGEMIVDLSTRRMATLEQVRAFVDGSAPVDYQPQDRTSTYAFVEDAPRRVGKTGVTTPAISPTRAISSSPLAHSMIQSPVSARTLRSSIRASRPASRWAVPASNLRAASRRSRSRSAAMPCSMPRSMPCSMPLRDLPNVTFPAPPGRAP